MFQVINVYTYRCCLQFVGQAGQRHEGHRMQSSSAIRILLGKVKNENVPSKIDMMLCFKFKMKSDFDPARCLRLWLAIEDGASKPLRWAQGAFTSHFLQSIWEGRAMRKHLTYRIFSSMLKMQYAVPISYVLSQSFGFSNMFQGTGSNKDTHSKEISFAPCCMVWSRSNRCMFQPHVPKRATCKEKTATRRTQRICHNEQTAWLGWQGANISYFSFWDCWLCGPFLLVQDVFF